MLILHQTGSVHVGEVVRYKLTYSPGLDRILPPPRQLHVKIKNTSAVPLRAAYLHGPYTLYVACYPLTFNPFTKHERADDEGAPDFEPQLKAGGSWTSKLTVPDDVYKDAEPSSLRDRDRERERNRERKSVTWVIEVASQVIFSTSAAVHFELLVGRDEKSIELGFHAVPGSGQGAPGRLIDHQQGRDKPAGQPAQPRGVFSKAAQLTVDDTEALWNTPSFPESVDEDQTTPVASPGRQQKQQNSPPKKEKQEQKQKKIHLVLLTHGLHSNLGADMLFLKESIDAAARQARLDAKKQREELRRQSAPRLGEIEKGEDDDDEEEEEEEEEEEVLVRGFSGNVVKTEKGIQYLGKRFAKYVLSITYPDQPYLPIKKKSLSKSIARTFTGSSHRDLTQDDEDKASHKHSRVTSDQKQKQEQRPLPLDHNLPYKITSISFVGHSLGGLIQTYAIAYIQKHSPKFFDLIRPINFIGLATPFLGLSNENPVYVKFALDFGLVGRTGQDLGLTWTPPTLAKNGWGAVISGLASPSDSQNRQANPGAKPLLRILPTGPAHTALKKFRNRTVYSNVVNDGIVPLRTSCLLFLDWSGLERVDKARREYGVVGTMVEWGLAEVMGQNASAPKRPLPFTELFSDGTTDDRARSEPSSPWSDPGSRRISQPEPSPLLHPGTQSDNHLPHDVPQPEAQLAQTNTDMDAGSNLWAGFVSLFRPQAGRHSSPSRSHLPKNAKIYRRGQTMKHTDTDSSLTAVSEEARHSRKSVVRGSSLYSEDLVSDEPNAPPKTSIFESAGDVLNPPLPSREFILDPSARPRTIFHDRVYHPDDIPPPPIKRPRTFLRRDTSKEGTTSVHSGTEGPAEGPGAAASPKTDAAEVGSMKVEEKIARAYHRDLSWRKVLVRLEPDAHNNMVVRRMFANAYGWPVVKHLCDTHFAYTATAQTRDEDEGNDERAQPADSAVGPHGEQVRGQLDAPQVKNKSTSDERAQLTRPHPVADAAPHAEDKVDNQNNDDDDDDDDDEQLPRIKKTVSESQESRDNITDLVSHVSVAGRNATSYSSNMKSDQAASAALSRLARKDSDAWSDKYVEDSESGEEDEQLLLELQRAQKRGEQLSPSQRMLLKRLSSSRSSFSNASPSLTLASNAVSPVDGQPRREPLPRLTSTDDRFVADDPEELEPMTDADPGHGHGHGHGHERSGSDRAPLSLVSVGLGKPIEEQITPPCNHGHGHGQGVGLGLVEHVVHARRRDSNSNTTTTGTTSRADGETDGPE